LLALY